MGLRLGRRSPDPQSPESPAGRVGRPAGNGRRRPRVFTLSGDHPDREGRRLASLPGQEEGWPDRQEAEAGSPPEGEVDTTIVDVALAGLSRGLSVPISTIQWVRGCGRRRFRTSSSTRIVQQVGGSFGATVQAVIRARGLAGPGTPLTALLRRAAERGEVRPEKVTPRIASLPGDLLRHQLLIVRAPASDRFLAEIVDDVLFRS